MCGEKMEIRPSLRMTQKTIDRYNNPETSNEEKKLLKMALDKTFSTW